MNLSLTPLNEAYSVQRPKPKTKQNVHSSVEVQKQMLHNASQKVHNELPSGYEVHQSGANYISSVNTNENNAITLKITDPELIEMLSIYKEDYISILFKNLLKKSEKMPSTKTRVEKFMDMPSFDESVFDTNLILSILIFILFADIILRLKYK